MEEEQGNDMSCPGGEEGVEEGCLNELIVNLDHELWEVRMRALESIVRKTECGLVTPSLLSRRIDLLHRLSDWIWAALDAVMNASSSVPKYRSWSVNAKIAQDGIPYILKLLIQMAEAVDVKDFIVEKRLDSALTQMQSHLSQESKSLMESLFDRINTGTFELQLDGSPEIWNDKASNRSVRNTLSTGRTLFEDGGWGDPHVAEVEDVKPNVTSDMFGGESYFTNQSLPSMLNKSMQSGFYFAIPVVDISSSDRKVLASAVESALSKNEALVLSTTCFFRDTLLEDFPPEVFIQESAISTAFMEIAESPWNDRQITEAVTQSLLILSHRLRKRMVELNSSEFYETKRSTSRSGAPFTSFRSSFPSTDTFVTSLCQLLKNISRTLLFHPNEFHLWRLLDDFSFTLAKCAHIFPVDYKTLSLGIQEILLDVAYCYEKYSDDINPTLLVLCMTSLLQALQTNMEDFIVAYDVRQCIRKLISCPLLVNYWPEMHTYLLDSALPLMDRSATEKIDQPLVEEMIPQTAMKKLLFAIQNATTHQNVLKAIDNLWSFVLPLTTNVRLDKGVLDHICQDLPWRDTFYRFFCVEPTCIEDENLLISVLGLMRNVIGSVINERKQMEDWIIPLCTENGCSFLKLLQAYSVTTQSPCAVPNILRSLFDFYGTLMDISSSENESIDEHRWNLFETLCLIFHKLGDMNFRCAAVAFLVLRGMSSLSNVTDITNRLSSNPKFCLALVYRLNELIVSLSEYGGGLSGEHFRNQGIFYYCSLCLYHVLTVLDKNSYKTGEWMGQYCVIIPCMWDSKNFRVRALGFQICEVISRGQDGVAALMGIMNSPNTVWISCYNTLTDVEEPAIVKQYAANVFLHLLTNWNFIKDSEIGKDLILPPWDIVEDLAKMLVHSYLCPTLSETFGSRISKDSTTAEDLSIPQLVPPKVLTGIAKILKTLGNVSLPHLSPDSFINSACSSGMCAVLFRLIGTNPLSPDLKPSWWIDTCSALSSVVETLITFCELDRGVAIILIGDKQSMTSLIQLLGTTQPTTSEDDYVSTTIEELRLALNINIFTLLTVLSYEAGNNFEDYRRCIFDQRHLIFSRIIEWLQSKALTSCRKIALAFLYELCSKLSKVREQEGQVDSAHPLFCRQWKEKGGTYGTCLCDSLIAVYEETNISEEKLSALSILNIIISVSSSTKTYAVEKGVASILINKLQYYASKYYESMETLHLLKKNNLPWLDDVLSILKVLSCLVYNNLDGKKSAVSCELADTLHKIFKWWTVYNDKILLHAFLEVLLNFTEEFPPGCHSLTLTSPLLGVGPKKAPSSQSLFSEVLDVLQSELSSIESCSVKSIELMFEVIKNATFVTECQNLLTKAPSFNFLTNLHVRDTKKWTPKQHRIKLTYLRFLLHVSIHPDIQTAICKITDSVSILVQLTNNGTDKHSSTLAIQILRNLNFQPANRTRLLCDDTVIPCYCTIIQDSEDHKQIEYAAVGLWALLANCEKGKLSAKKYLCPSVLEKTILRLRKLEQSSHDLLTQKKDLSNLIDILITLSQILGVNVSSNPQRLNC